MAAGIDTRFLERVRRALGDPLSVEVTASGRTVIRVLHGHQEVTVSAEGATAVAATRSRDGMLFARVVEGKPLCRRTRRPFAGASRRGEKVG